MSKDELDTTEQWSRPTGGIFITRGMTVGIPAGGLTIKLDEKGEISADPITLHVHYDGVHPNASKNTRRRSPSADCQKR